MRFSKQWLRLAPAIALALAGCSGGGSDDSSGGDYVPPASEKHTNLEDYIFYQGRFSMPSQTKVYKGAFSPLDLALTRPLSGNPLSEVNVAGQETPNIPFKGTQINGHRAHLSDGSFIDFKCDSYAYVTFPSDAKRLIGTFQADYRILGRAEANGIVDYSLFIQLSNRLRFSDLEDETITDIITYAGYTPSQDTHEVQKFTLNYQGTLGGPLVAGETAGGFAALSDIRVKRIEKFADMVGEPELGETRLCALAKEYHLPEPGFDPSGRSYTGLSPWGCWKSVVQGKVWPDPFTAEEEDNCAAWTQEKGWVREG